MRQFQRRNGRGKRKKARSKEKRKKEHEEDRSKEEKTETKNRGRLSIHKTLLVGRRRLLRLLETFPRSIFATMCQTCPVSLDVWFEKWGVWHWQLPTHCITMEEQMKAQRDRGMSMLACAFVHTLLSHRY